MKYLVLSDIHGNVEALDTVLADAASAGYDATICLGDLVGYGGAPADVIARIQALAPQWIIRGNHDRVCAGITEAATFSPTARLAIEWTRRQLTVEQLAWLAAVPTGPVMCDDTTMICHGAPHDEDFYVLDRGDARMVFLAEDAPVCLHGHTHAQTVFRLAGQVVHDETPARRARWTVTLDRGSRWLVNPGSVGQPRDSDPRAAYALFDTQSGCIELRRIVYDVAAAQQRIRAAGLPEVLARRLATGD
jgi:predicted phosphodiesterase